MSTLLKKKNHTRRIEWGRRHEQILPLLFVLYIRIFISVYYVIIVSLCFCRSTFKIRHGGNIVATLIAIDGSFFFFFSHDRLRPLNLIPKKKKKEELMEEKRGIPPNART